MSSILIQVIVFILLVLLLAKPLGIYISKVFKNEKVFLSKIIRPVEKFIYKVLKVNEKEESCSITVGFYHVRFHVGGVW